MTSVGGEIHGGDTSVGQGDKGGGDTFGTVLTCDLTGNGG